MTSRKYEYPIVQGPTGQDLMALTFFPPDEGDSRERTVMFTVKANERFQQETQFEFFLENCVPVNKFRREFNLTGDVIVRVGRMRDTKPLPRREHNAPRFRASIRAYNPSKKTGFLKVRSPEWSEDML